jgi:hypothetical protein
MITQASAFAEQRQHDRALAGFRDALVRLERLAELFSGPAGLAVEAPEVMRLWVEACVNLARVASEAGDQDEVVRVSRRGLALAAECQEAAQTSDVRDLHHSLVTAHDRRATALINKNPLEAAAEEFRSSAEAGEQLLEYLRRESLAADDELIYRLARTYLHQARVAMRCCRPEAVWSACERALTLLESTELGNRGEPGMVLQTLSLERKAMLLMERLPDFRRAVERAIQLVRAIARELQTALDISEVRAEVVDLDRTIHSMMGDAEHFSEPVRRSLEEQWQPLRQLFRL